MTIYGLSQSSGAERRLTVEMGGEGVVLTVTDHASGGELGRVVVPQAELVSALVAPPAGGATVGGARPVGVEVCRNEVLLRGSGWDAAVGLDDLRDALEGVIPAG